MKTLIVTIAMAMIASSAQASFMQTECSNADGSIRTSAGHVSNDLNLVLKTYDDMGKPQVDTLSIDLYNVDLTPGRRTEISSKNEEHCPKGSKYGMSSWETITVEEVVIKAKDGSFPQGTSDLQNGMISTTLLCKLVGNSEMPCNKK